MRKGDNINTQQFIYNDSYKVTVEDGATDGYIVTPRGARKFRLAKPRSVTPRDRFWDVICKAGHDPRDFVLVGAEAVRKEAAPFIRAAYERAPKTADTQFSGPLFTFGGKVQGQPCRRASREATRMMNALDRINHDEER